MSRHSIDWTTRAPAPCSAARQRMKVRDVIRRLLDDGWVRVAQKGSHRQFKHPTKYGKVTVQAI
jgi:predicted RNA binding protein YcfA (HicA-like mRNA interferase family)